MGTVKNTLRCLVADDEAQIGFLLREALIQQGYAADVVTDGEAASRKLKEGGYALIVSDVMMPFKTGVELLHEVRARGDATPAVLMSSYLSEEILSSCRDVKQLAFLQKPFALADLRSAVERAVSSVRC
jgi:DNA-binding response OmpR family regulator